MKITPDQETLRALAKEGKYDVAPVRCELLSDIRTPIEALKILKNVSTHCFLLESVTEREKWGRYTFLGFDPKMSITCTDGRLQAGSITMETDDPSACLRQVLSGYRSPRLEGMPPFTGGLVGYFAYDYLAYSEPTVKREVLDSEEFKDVDLMLFDKVICFDSFRQKILLIANVPLKDVETGWNRAKMELENLAKLMLAGEAKEEPAGRMTGDVKALFDRERWKKPSTTSAKAIFSRSCSPTAWRRPLRAACWTPTGCCGRSIPRPTCSTSPGRTWRSPARARKRS